MMKNKELIFGVVLGLLASCFLIVGTMDYQDARVEQAHYCQMVEEGVWPDYRETYEESCRQAERAE